MLRVCISAIALFCCGSVAAQEPPIPAGRRIRVTTASAVVVPGVLTMNRNELRTQLPILASDRHSVTLDTGANGPLTVQKPGTRTAGTLASFDHEALVLVAEGRPMLIPRDAIAVIELSSASRSRRERAARGAMIGAAGGAGLMLGMRAG